MDLRVPQVGVPRPVALTRQFKLTHYPYFASLPVLGWVVGDRTGCVALESASGRVAGIGRTTGDGAVAGAIVAGIVVDVWIISSSPAA